MLLPTAQVEFLQRRSCEVGKAFQNWRRSSVHHYRKERIKVMYKLGWMWKSRVGRFREVDRSEKFRWSKVWHAGTVYETLLKTCSYETYMANREDMRRKRSKKAMPREIPKGLIEHWMYLLADLLETPLLEQLQNEYGKRLKKLDRFITFPARLYRKNHRDNEKSFREYIPSAALTRLHLRKALQTGVHLRAEKKIPSATLNRLTASCNC